MNYCTIGPYLFACARNPKVEEEASSYLAVLHHISLFSSVILLKLLPDLPVTIEMNLAGFIMAGRALNLK